MYTIYALVDPRDEATYYVGLTFALMRIRVMLEHSSHVLSFLSEKQGVDFEIHTQELSPKKNSLIILISIYSEHGWVMLLQWMTAAKVCGLIRYHKQARFAEWMREVEKTKGNKAS